MATKTESQLKAFFETGDKPSSTEFGHVMDSHLNLTDGGTIQSAADIDFAGLGTLKGNLR